MTEVMGRDAEAAMDRALVDRAQRGDGRAFDLLVRKYRSRMEAIVLRLLPQRADAEDVVQETWIKVHRALPEFRGESAFFSWVYRIAINVARTQGQQRQRRGLNHSVAWEDAEEKGDAALVDVASPEAEVLKDEMMQVLQQAIASLPEEFRLAYTLREMEGLNYEDIALTLECPVGTVRSRIYRAREIIDEVMRPWWAPAGGMRS